MTLRATIEIIPFGDETLKEEICRLDISNEEFVEDQGFGHILCNYHVKLYRHFNESQQDLLKEPEWELVNEGYVSRHNRRDGAVSLVKKACSLMEHSL